MRKKNRNFFNFFIYIFNPLHTTFLLFNYEKKKKKTYESKF